MLKHLEGKRRKGNARSFQDRGFLVLALAVTILSIGILAFLIASIVMSGFMFLSLDFLTGYPSKDATISGFLPAIMGTVFVLFVCAIIGIPLGISTAILLEEYQPKKNGFLKSMHGIVQLNITNLAGVPSIVYGILGLTAFANMFGLFGSTIEPHFVVGQSWYHRYMDVSGKSYYLPISAKSADPKPASQELNLLASTSAYASPAKVQFVPASKIEPLKTSVEREIGRFEDSLNASINATRGPRRIGKAEISKESATAFVDKAFKAASFQKDVASQKDRMIALVASMNGLDGPELRAVRRQVYAIVDNVEREGLLEGLIVQGSLPTRVDERAWYYFALPLGRGVLAGALTLMLVILPIIIVATQEALRAIPQSMRHGVLALGGTKWQSISKIALPAAIPGICTGSILALSRAIGEAAPLLVIAGIVFITFTPSNLMDDFTVMPLQIYNWASRPSGDFHSIAATGIIVLLVVLLCFNGLAVFIRNKFQKPLS